MAGVGLTVSSPLRRFADRLLARADRATSSRPGAGFSVAGRGIEVRFASKALHDTLAPAWSALPPLDGTATATIHVVDRDASGDPPAPPWSANAYRPRDELEGVGDERLEVGYQLVTATLMMWDAATRTGVWWTRSAAEVPVWERAMPLRAVLRWALREQGVALVHGAALGGDDAMALLVGAGGAGKSTLALAAQQAGWRYVADDYCAVDPVTRAVAPVTSYAKVTAATLALLPGLGPLRAPLPPAPDGKSVLALRPAPGGRLDLIALPRVVPTGGPPVAVGPAATMAALAPTSLLQMPGSRATDRELLGQVVRGLPAVALPSGPDLVRTLAGLRRALEHG
jgi:hypothetical protein